MRISLFIKIALTSSLLFTNSFSEILTLKDAETTALKDAFEIKAKQKERNSKMWEKRNTITNYLPSVDYNFNFVRIDDDTYDLAKQGSEYTGQPVYQHSYSHEIAITQPITNGGAELYAINIANHSEKAFNQDEIVNRNSVILEVRKTYYALISANKFLEINRRSLEWTKKKQEQTKLKFQSGLVPEVEVLKWQSDVVSAEKNVSVAENSVRVLTLQLYSQLGKKVEDVPTEVTLDDFSIFEEKFNNLHIVDGDYENNSLIKSIEEYTKVSEGYKDLTTSNFLPKINAFAKYSLPTMDEITPEFDNSSWTIGVAATVPIFHSFKNYTARQQAVYSYEESLINEQKTKNGLKINCERLKMSLETAKKNVAASKSLLELMQKQKSMLEQRYEEGFVTQLELSDIALTTDKTEMGYIQELLNALALETEYLISIGKLEV